MIYKIKKALREEGFLYFGLTFQKFVTLEKFYRKKLV